MTNIYRKNIFKLKGRFYPVFLVKKINLPLKLLHVTFIAKVYLLFLLDSAIKRIFVHWRLCLVCQRDTDREGNSGDSYPTVDLVSLKWFWFGRLLEFGGKIYTTVLLIKSSMQ